MVDWFDRAQAQEQRERDRAIAAQLDRPRPSGPSRTHCEDCDNEIPAARQALGGAALDVHDVQPLPADAPIRRAPRVLLTPHVAGTTATSMHRMSTGAVDDMLRILRGESPAHPVNRF